MEQAMGPLGSLKGTLDAVSLILAFQAEARGSAQLTARPRMNLGLGCGLGWPLTTTIIFMIGLNLRKGSGLRESKR